MRRTRMDEIVENMANYICDRICKKPKEITDQEEMESVLCGKNARWNNISVIS